MKKILSIGFVLALIGGFVAYKMWTKPHEDMQTASADLSVAAMDLYTQFSDDETAANAAFLEKVVQVSGAVSSVTKEGEVTKVMLQAADDAMGGVYCELDPLTTHARTDFPEGESVKLKCHCTGFTGIDVQMARCVEVK